MNTTEISSLHRPKAVLGYYNELNQTKIYSSVSQGSLGYNLNLELHFSRKKGQKYNDFRQLF
jgi:hypothetical protein